jgi:hypothetical protein
MKDFIGHEVKSGDYVVATVNGALRVCTVVRVTRSIVHVEADDYLFFFLSEQIAWIDPEKAMLSILES